MINKDLQDNAEDETLSVGDVKIQQMIKNLHTVDAPKDFDFRLKARIANAKPTNNVQPRFFSALRYVLPLSVVVLIFTFVIINGVYFAGNNQTVAEVQPIPVENKTSLTNDFQIAPPEVAQMPVESVPQPDLANSNLPKVEVQKKAAIPVEQTNLVAVKSPKRSQVGLPQVKDDDDSGSRLTSFSVPKVITPNGIPSDDLVENSPNNENKNDVITKQILLPLGIEIVSVNGKRRVQSVKKESIAARSGVKVGDLVEEIDGEKVSGDAVRGKKLEGKQIIVMRGTEKVEITFDNK